MEKYFFSLVLLSIIVGPYFSYADSYATRRSKCGIRNKFSTYAKVKKCGGLWSTDSHDNCVGNSSYNEKLVSCSASVGQVYAAMAKGQADYSAVNSSQYTNQVCGCYTAGIGYKPTNYFFDFTPIEEPMVGYGEEQHSTFSEVSVKDVLFNNNTVKMTEVAASIMVGNYSPISKYSALKITIGAEDEHGEIINVLWEGRAILFGGELLTSGGLTNGDFVASNIQDGIKYTLNMNELEANFSNQENTDNLVVKVSTDGGGTEEGIPEEFMVYNNARIASIKKEVLQNANLNFEIIPNPSSGNSQITIDSKIDCNAQINVYDINGGLVKSVKTIEIKKTNINLVQLNLSDLQNGVYFIKIETSEKNYVKIFTKQ